MKKLLLVAVLALTTVLVLPSVASAKTPTLKSLAKTVAALQKKVNAQATTIASLTTRLTAAEGKIATLDPTQGATIAALSTKLTADEAMVCSWFGTWLVVSMLRSRPSWSAIERNSGARRFVTTRVDAVDGAQRLYITTSPPRPTPPSGRPAIEVAGSVAPIKTPTSTAPRRSAVTWEPVWFETQWHNTPVTPSSMARSLRAAASCSARW